MVEERRLSLDVQQMLTVNASLAAGPRRTFAPTPNGQPSASLSKAAYGTQSMPPEYDT